MTPLRSTGLALALLSSSTLHAQDVNTPPVRLNDVKPAYTPDAMRARIYGEVIVAFEIKVDGTTANFTIVKSLDDKLGLDQQAIEAVKQWRYKPATRNGVPVPTHATATLNFTLVDRDGTVLRAPSTGPPAPVSTWPPSFSNEISEPGATWKPGTAKLGDTTLSFEAPAGWTVRQNEEGRLRLFVGDSGRRSMMTGLPMKTPGPMMLPLPPDMVARFAHDMAAQPMMAKASIQGSGQVQIGSKWWLWLELTPGSDFWDQMPPELRDAIGAKDFSDIRMWSFVTSNGNDLVQLMFTNWLPQAASDREVELRDATSVFRVILSKISFAK